MLKLTISRRKKNSPLINYFSKKIKNRMLLVKRQANAGSLQGGDLVISSEQAASDPAIMKLLEYAKNKKTLSYEELSDFLPEHITNSDKIEQVLALLEANNVQLVEEDASSEDDESDIDSLLSRIKDAPLKNFIASRGTSAEFSGGPGRDPRRLMEDGINGIRKKRLRKRLAEISAQMRNSERFSEDDGEYINELLAEKKFIDSQMRELDSPL